MRKILSIIVVLALLIALCMPTTAFADSEEFSVDLLAGKSDKVGEVIVTNDVDNITVKYVLDEEAIEAGWVLTEVHLDVKSEEADIPQTKKGNPIPGHFEFSDYFDYTELKTEVSFDVPIDGRTSVVIAAHAVVSDEPNKDLNGRMFGTKISGGTKGLYEIDVVTGTVSLLKAITGTAADVDNRTGYTNGLAYDPGSNKLFFTAPASVNVSVSPLWAYDIGTDTLEWLCDLEGSVVSGSFYNGAYYYIAEGVNELMKIDNPAVGCSPVSVISGFGVAGEFTFGDIAISEAGMIYGSTRVSPQMFFSLDLDSEVYSKYVGADALDLQLAYGSNGVLYGVRHSTGLFNPINVDTGMKEAAIFTSAGFADLASGTLFEAQDESAWGDGDRFVKKGNWATYFEYDLQPVLVDTVTILADTPVPYEPVIAYSNIVLEEGETYKLVASGTADANDTITFDAKYSLTGKVPGDTWTDLVSAYETHAWGTELLDLFVNGVAGDWGEYSETHIYDMTLEGNGNLAEFFINDSYPQNNSGFLTVDIYWMP